MAALWSCTGTRCLQNGRAAQRAHLAQFPRSGMCQQQTQQRPTLCQASLQDPYDFRSEDFHRVAFVPPPYGPMKLYEDSKGAATNGVLVFKRESDVLSNDDLDVVEVFVSGDACHNTWNLLTHQVTDRPMVHELMFNVLDRLHGYQAREWALLRVAIVELKDNIFIGRLFFGDAITGETKWDCDCRPSDASYLCLRAQVPFFIHRRVWDQTCQPIRTSVAYSIVAGSAQRASPVSQINAGSGGGGGGSKVLDPQGAPYQRGGSGSGGGGGSSGSSGGGGGGDEWQGRAANPTASPDTLTMEEVSLLRPDDPDAIRLLKRQLALAVAEENYSEAIRIRDHAWMLMYRDIHTLRLRGRYGEAHRVELELKRQIQAVEEGSTQEGE